jgi:hypothetical protein
LSAAVVGSFVTFAPLAGWTRAFDVMPDGRILIVDGEDLSAQGELRMVLNWHEELKRLVPTP